MNKFPLILPDDLINEYQDNGFVVTENSIPIDELFTYGEAVNAEVERRTANDSRSVSEKSTYEQSFIQCMRLWETDSTVRSLTCSKTIAGLAAQLMQANKVRLWQDQALYKEAAGRKTDAHQDQPFWPIGTVPLISAWIPFEDVTKADGCMAYVPGSHKSGGLRVVDITHKSEPYDILRDPALAGRKPVDVEVKAGSIIWHNGFTVHAARPNLSPKPRRVFTVVYFAEGYPRTKSWPVFPLDRDGVEVGGLMQGPGMPVLWPPTDSLPTPPAELGQPTGPQY